MQVSMMRALRRAQDLSQRELGELCGVSRSLISLIETGCMKPYRSLKERIAEALGVEVEDIWNDDES